VVAAGGFVLGVLGEDVELELFARAGDQGFDADVELGESELDLVELLFDIRDGFARCLDLSGQLLNGLREVRDGLGEFLDLGGELLLMFDEGGFGFFGLVQFGFDARLALGELFDGGRDAVDLLLEFAFGDG